MVTQNILRAYAGNAQLQPQFFSISFLRKKAAIFAKTINLRIWSWVDPDADPTCEIKSDHTGNKILDPTFEDPDLDSN